MVLFEVLCGVLSDFLFAKGGVTSLKVFVETLQSNCSQQIQVICVTGPVCGRQHDNNIVKCANNRAIRVIRSSHQIRELIIGLVQLTRDDDDGNLLD